VSSSRRWIDPEHRLDYLAGLGIRRDHYLAGLGIRRDLPAFNSLLDDEAI
jgi:hypothetical protein